MVAIDEDEINSRFAAGSKLVARVSASRADPADPALGDLRQFLHRNQPLDAKSKPSGGKRIDADEHSVESHCAPETGGRHAMPGANFDQPFAAGGKASQTGSFLIASLSLSPSQTEQP
jgi:hypothetical protein